MIRVLLFSVILLLSTKSNYSQNAENYIVHLKEATLAIAQKDTSLWNSLVLSKYYIDTLIDNKKHKIDYDNEFFVLKNRIDSFCTLNMDTSIRYDVFKDFDRLIDLAKIEKSEFKSFEIGAIKLESKSVKDKTNIDEYKGSFVLINKESNRKYLIAYENVFRIFDEFFDFRIISIKEL